MHRCFFITTVTLITLVSSQRVGLFSFTHLKGDEIVNCVYDYIKEVLVNAGYQDADLDDVILDVASQTTRLYNVSEVDADFIKKMVADSIDFLMSQDDYIIRPDIPWGTIKVYTINSLMVFCSDSFLPFYEYEPRDVANILDYILVNWNESIYDMARTQKGRSILSIYTVVARTMIEKVFSCYNVENFRALVRTLWILRAQKHFNVSNVLYPYLPHIFDKYRLFPLVEPEYFDEELLNRPSTSTGVYGNWENRNPMASLEDLDRILNIHTADRSSIYYECDIFSVYARNGLSYAEYYFEWHNDQFNRIIFFFLELEARNISSDVDDRSAAELIPQELYEMLRNDSVYRDYLLRLREIYGDPTSGILRQNLASSSRVIAENLILLLIIERPTNHISSTNSTVIVTTTTTPRTTTDINVFISSTTNRVPQDNEEKNSVFEKYCGKYPTKQLEENFSSSCCLHDSGDKNSDFNQLINYAICYRRCKRKKINPNNYGYFMYSDDSNHYPFTVKESSFYTQLLGSLLTECVAFVG